jgi:cell division protein FtsN
LARNDEGEFELVLGNRQLISVFLIVVILLAVLFSMGYIVGRNSSAVVADTTRSGSAAKPIVVERAADSSTPSNPPSSPSTEPANSKPTAAGPPITKPEKPATAATSAPPPSPAKETKPQVLTPSAPASATGEPAAGQYWQVVATSRPDAEIISEALGKKGFHSVVAPGPRDNIFRVLVGPFKDAATLAQGRADLEASGFKNPIMRRY